MLKGIGIGILIGVFIIGLLWFFTGRIQLGPILATSEAIRTEIGATKSIGDNISSRLDEMGNSTTRLSDRIETIKEGSDSITGRSGDIVYRSNELIKRSNTIERGLTDTAESVKTNEGRFGLIVGKIGELRDITEAFREAIESREMEN